jgi:hypothetical protein
LRLATKPPLLDKFTTEFANAVPGTVTLWLAFSTPLEITGAAGTPLLPGTVRDNNIKWAGRRAGSGRGGIRRRE